ncbi:hypothetical protein BJ508DRAFT_419690 [Ascobolus immersus RN42]|uniref:Uncharacterized protein n=1 Tax=Ascobolus immersus RN42 TaxID=1160509 RepID=A0A3N4HC93_ASCIM|nr:hypothetical protein BJ508DRAFT_419690 [Ascobolus immersus RN42]
MCFSPEKNNSNTAPRRATQYNRPKSSKPPENIRLAQQPSTRKRRDSNRKRPSSASGPSSPPSIPPPTRSETPPAASTAAAVLSDLIKEPHDDVTITRAFATVARRVLDHSIEFYTTATFKTLGKQERSTVLKHFKTAEVLLRNEDNVKGVVMGVIGGEAWEWAADGKVLREFRTINEEQSDGGEEGSIEEIGSHVSGVGRVDRSRLLRVLETQATLFVESRAASEKQIASHLHQVLSPFAIRARNQDERRLRSLEALVSSVLNLRIVLDVQSGKWRYRIFGFANLPCPLDRNRMESLEDHLQTEKAVSVQGVGWPGLEKAEDPGRGQGGSKMLRERKVLTLAKAKVLMG